MRRCRAEKERRISEIINSTSRFSSNLLFSGKKRIYLEVWEIWGKFWLVKNSFWSPQYWRRNERFKKALKKWESFIPTLSLTTKDRQEIYEVCRKLFVCEKNMLPFEFTIYLWTPAYCSILQPRLFKKCPKYKSKLSSFLSQCRVYVNGPEYITLK